MSQEGLISTIAESIFPEATRTKSKLIFVSILKLQNHRFPDFTGTRTSLESASWMEFVLL